MYVVLLAFGLVLAVAGIGLIVFGESTTTTNLGNALVTAGTIVSIGSLVLIGLSSAVRQLRRIAQVLESRPGAPVPEAAETVQRIHPPVLTPPPPIVARVEVEPERAPIVEPKVDVVLAPPPPPVPPPLSSPEPVPPPPLSSEPAPPPPEPEPSPEPIPAPLSRPEPAPAAANEPEPITSSPARPPPVPPSLVRPPPPPQPPKNTFEAIWAGDAEVAPRPPRPESVRPAAPRRMEPEVMAPPPAAEPEPPPAVPPEAPPAVPPEAPPVAPRPEPEAEIFKSGVIDGMAYTLYTDGSIEAELAHGTVKFASIDELRAYLMARDS